MSDLVALLKVVGAMATIVASIVRLVKWLRPVKISLSCNLVLDGTGLDEIRATVTNKTGKTIYITSCVSRGTYRRRDTLLRLLNQPFMSPRFYPVIRFCGPTHELLSNSPLKIEPQQPVELRHLLSNHPFSKFRSSQFLIEVELSNGRRFRSRRLNVPARWRLVGIG